MARRKRFQRLREVQFQSSREVKKVSPPPPPQRTPGNKLASVFIPTAKRPHLLKLVLSNFARMPIPKGWDLEVVVCGTSEDPGKSVTSATSARYLVCAEQSVTSKLNLMLSQTKADLVILADDDDIQPPNRISEAILAHEEGYDWSGSGELYFYHPEEDALVYWSGRASRGLVGTSMSYRTRILKKVGGWPKRSKGKDGPLAERVRKAGGKFKDLSKALGPGLVALQHGGNMWHRPALSLGQKSRKGWFNLEGRGGLSDVDLPSSVKDSLMRVKGGAPLRIAITTYNRPDLCLNLLKDIREWAPVGAQVEVFDDFSTLDYSEVISFLETQGWAFNRAPRNYGKKQWWRQVNHILSKWHLDKNSQYFYLLQDDIRLCDSFFSRTMELWDGISDPNKATLYLLRDEHRNRVGVKCWTGYPSRVEGAVERTQWVDCAAFMAGRAMLETLKGKLDAIPLSRWEGSPTLSSGVGQQLSQRLHRQGKGMFRALSSYVLHLDESESKMNTRERNRNPMRGVSFIDGVAGEAQVESRGRDPITVSLASIPSRRGSLQKVISRLLPQVDRVNVYLNETPTPSEGSGYPKIPDFLKHPKVNAVWSRDTSFGDQGDAGKFYWASEVQGWHIVCDDDVMYPPDFVRTLIKSAEQYNKRCVVGLHGAVLTEPFRSYYGSRETYHFSSALKRDTPVHVLASNSLCYHTDTIKVHRDDFKHPNMGDIWFGLLAQQQNVPLVCVRHRKGWVVDDPSTRKDSIYAHSKGNARGSQKNTAEIQTRVVKANMPWEARDGKGRVVRRVGAPLPLKEQFPSVWPSQKPSVEPFNHGWLVPGTRRMLAKHLHSDMKVVLELGVWLGKSTQFILSEAPSATVVSVDLWDSEMLGAWADKKNPSLSKVSRRAKETFMVNLWDKRERVIPLQTSSVEGVGELKVRGIVPDLVYLDTSHRHPETLEEIQAILTAFPDTVLVGDDWESVGRRSRKEVQISVMQFVKENPHWQLEVDENGWALVKA